MTKKGDRTEGRTAAQQTAADKPVPRCHAAKGKRGRTKDNADSAERHERLYKGIRQKARVYIHHRRNRRRQPGVCERSAQYNERDSEGIE